MSRIREEKSGKSKSFRVIFDDGTSSKYSETRYGDKALPLAKLAMNNNIKYKNYFEIDGNTVKLFLWFKPEKQFKIAYLDKEDFERDDIRLNYWQAKKDKQNYYVYREVGNSRLGNKEPIRLHNEVFSLSGIDTVVDHKNSNGLDNRKKNLRELSKESNSKNINRFKGKIPIVGIQYRENTNSFEATWYDSNKKPKSKSFSINKYSAKTALLKACEYRNRMIDEYKYTCEKIDLNDEEMIENVLNIISSNKDEEE